LRRRWTSSTTENSNNAPITLAIVDWEAKANSNAVNTNPTNTPGTMRRITGQSAC